jgi:hypothetical protein
VLKIY